MTLKFYLWDVATFINNIYKMKNRYLQQMNCVYIVSNGKILFLMNWLQGNRANEWILKINAKNGKRRKNVFFMNRRKTQYYYECV